MNSFRLAMIVAAGVAFSAAAHAAPIITASTSLPANFPTLGNFGTSNTSGLVSTAPIQIANSGVITFGSGASPMAGVYSGNSTGIAVAPISPTANYLVAQPSGTVTISYGSNNLQSAFSLLWGSVDSYNDLTLQLNNGNTVVDTVTGSQIAAVAGIPSNGTAAAFVTISNLPAKFDTVVLRSGQSAFEFIPSVQVPEPASLAVLGFGLAGLGLVRTRRAKKA